MCCTPTVQETSASVQLPHRCLPVRYTFINGNIWKNNLLFSASLWQNCLKLESNSSSLQASYTLDKMSSLRLLFRRIQVSLQTHQCGSALWFYESSDFTETAQTQSAFVNNLQGGYVWKHCNRNLSQGQWFQATLINWLSGVCVVTRSVQITGQCQLLSMSHAATLLRESQQKKYIACLLIIYLPI